MGEGGGSAYIRNHFCVSVLMGLYTEGLYSEFYDIPIKVTFFILLVHPFFDTKNQSKLVFLKKGNDVEKIPI